MRSSCLGSTGHNSSCVAKRDVVLNSKAILGRFQVITIFFAQNLEIRYNVRFDITYFTL
jgi:hypothetical protein